MIYTTNRITNEINLYHEKRQPEIETIRKIFKITASQSTPNQPTFNAIYMMCKNAMLNAEPNINHKEILNNVEQLINKTK